VLYSGALLVCLTDSPPSAIYTLSLHDALPICQALPDRAASGRRAGRGVRAGHGGGIGGRAPLSGDGRAGRHPRRTCRVSAAGARSEEHTSELQSRENLVCRLLLEKKKKKAKNVKHTMYKRYVRGIIHHRKIDKRGT